MHLWYPETLDEITFIKSQFPSSTILHVGYRQYIPDHGILHSDNSIGIGIPLITHDPSGTPFITDESSNYISNDECLIFDTNLGQLVRNVACINAKAICKSKIGKIT